jgi:hypothetical protein
VTSPRAVHEETSRISDGDTKVVKLDADGGGMTTVWFGVWTLGWS